MKITKEEFQGWKLSPVTEFFFSYLNDCREEIKEYIAEGTYTHTDQGQTLQKTCDIIGRCTMLKNILNLEYEDIEDFYQQPKLNEENNE